MIGAVRVVVPAHDEEQLVGDCLTALAVAAGHVDVPVDITVVLDACSDATGAICARHAVRTLTVPWRNVGAARATGFADASDSADVWLATTDADTRVAPDWLVAQLRLADDGADAVLGVVDVEWSPRQARTRVAFTRLYDGTARGSHGAHRHVHGANLGVRAAAYRRVGGFAPLLVREDHDLAGRLDDDPDVTVVRSTAVRATTSARTDPRAAGGFGDLLASLT